MKLYIVLYQYKDAYPWYLAGPFDSRAKAAGFASDMEFRKQKTVIIREIDTDGE